MSNASDLQLPDWAYELLLTIAIKKIRFKQDEEAACLLSFLSLSHETTLVRRLSTIVGQLRGVATPSSDLTDLSVLFSVSEFRHIEARNNCLNGKRP